MLTRRFFSVFITLSAICVKPAMAGWLGIWGGISPPLVEKFDSSHQGVALDIEFTVKKKCAYTFNIDFLHRDKQWNELKDLLRGGEAKKGIILPVHLTIEKPDSKEGEYVFDEVVETCGATAHSSSSTERTVGHSNLDPGKYRAILKMSQYTPELSGIETNFVIRVRPKTNCP